MFTKDYFYDAGKKKYISVRIDRIAFDDSFKKAVVTVVGKTEEHMAGQAVVMDEPQDTHWKIENGKWCWTYHPEDFPITPMGGKNPPVATGAMADHIAATKPKDGSVEETRKAGMAVLNQQPMGTDKDVVTFVADQPGSAKVVFTNGADGPIQVNLDGPVVRGLKVDVDRKNLPGHETAVLSFRYDPTDKTQEKGMWEPKGNIKFRIYASPFDRVFPVEVQFVGK